MVKPQHILSVNFGQEGTAEFDYLGDFTARSPPPGDRRQERHARHQLRYAQDHRILHPSRGLGLLTRSFNNLISS